MWLLGELREEGTVWGMEKGRVGGEEGKGEGQVGSGGGVSMGWKAVNISETGTSPQTLQHSACQGCA